MKRAIWLLAWLLCVSPVLFGQGVNGPRGTIWINDATTGTGTNLLAVSSGVDNTAINSGSATTKIIGVCIQGCGTNATSAQSVIANWGDVPCSFTGTATDGDYVQPAGSGSQCADVVTPTSGVDILGIVKKGGTGAGIYTVAWRGRTSAGGGDPIAYQNIFTGINPPTAAGNVALTGCASGVCTVVPAGGADGTYDVKFILTQTTAGTGCTGSTVMGLRINYTDGDNLTAATSVIMNMTGASTGALANATSTAANAANGTGSVFSSLPHLVHIKGTAALTFNLNSTTPVTGCTPGPFPTGWPQWTLRIVWFGPLSYM